MLRIILVALTFSLPVLRLLDPLFVDFGELFVPLLLRLALILTEREVGSPVVEVDVLNDIELLLTEHVLEHLTVILLQIVKHFIRDFLAALNMELVHDNLFDVEAFLGQVFLLVRLLFDFALCSLFFFRFFLALSRFLRFFLLLLVRDPLIHQFGQLLFELASNEAIPLLGCGHQTLEGHAPLLAILLHLLEHVGQLFHIVAAVAIEVHRGIV